MQPLFAVPQVPQVPKHHKHHFQRFQEFQAAWFGLPTPAADDDDLSKSPTADPDDDNAKLPSLINLPHTWTLGAPAPSEELGALLSTVMSAGTVGRVSSMAGPTPVDLTVRVVQSLCKHAKSQKVGCI